MILARALLLPAVLSSLLHIVAFQLGFLYLVRFLVICEPSIIFLGVVGRPSRSVSEILTHP